MQFQTQKHAAAILPPSGSENWEINRLFHRSMMYSRTCMLQDAADVLGILGSPSAAPALIKTGWESDMITGIRCFCP